MIKISYVALLWRGRRKKILSLIFLLFFLLNAMIYVSLELYNKVAKRKDSWYDRLEFDQNSYVDKSGMRVIVGHYIGGITRGNLTEEDVHSNRYAPVKGAGELGRPVMLSYKDQIRSKELFPLHSYNILVSDMISINRSLPDMRSESCRQIEYNLDNLPTATVIIVFHNEAWSTLMRTVMSVILRSPPSLLKEIILVDDASDRRYLGKELEDAVDKLENVRILRQKERIGLVGARLKGAREARGDALVFLDAHCEVTQGWLEPLLERAGGDDVFICPHIDLLSEDTLDYVRSLESHGAFSWRLHFRWLFPSTKILLEKENHPSRPYPTPAMAGGLFAVRKSLFWRLGGYDEGMQIWGAENLEMSWRVWQCGAKIEITPCSRVGHIFRRHSPYKFPGGVGNVLYKNIARAASVWMDEWADFYFKFNPSIASLRDQLQVADRVKLRKTLNCKSFKWYLDNVWPEHFFPTDDRWFGTIRNDRFGCLGVRSSSHGGTWPALALECGGDYDLDTLAVFTPEGKIMVDNGLCLEQATGGLVWKSCREDNKRQIWLQEGPRLKTKAGLCLTLSDVNDRKEGESVPLILKKCIENVRQIWHFERVPWH